MRYLLLLALLSACGSSNETASSSNSTVLKNWGMYYDLPLQFSQLRLNQPNIVQYDIHQGGAFVATCGAIITLSGTETSGTFATSSGVVIYIPPGSGTTLCSDYGNLGGTYSVSGNTMVLSGGSFASHGGGLQFEEMP